MVSPDVHIGHTNIQKHKGLNEAQHCDLKITVPDYIKSFWKSKVGCKYCPVKTLK